MTPMNEPRPLLQTWLPAAAGLLLVGAGFAVGSRAGGGLVSGFAMAIIAMGLILAGAVCLALPLSRLLSRGAGGLYFPDEKLDRPPPLYSRAEALAKMDRFDEAMAAYEAIARDYPDEVKPYIDMIEIAIRHYRDPERANRIFRQGIAALRNGDDRDTLSRMYRGIRSRIAEKKDWQKSRTLRLGE